MLDLIKQLIVQFGPTLWPLLLKLIEEMLKKKVQPASASRPRGAAPLSAEKEDFVREVAAQGVNEEEARGLAEALD